MTTTPEQLQAWREEAKAAYLADPNPDGWHSAVQSYINGYLRRCQETEQAMKLAKFGAMVAHFQFNKGGCSDAYMEDLADECGLFLNRSDEFAPNIEATIKELLK